MKKQLSQSGLAAVAVSLIITIVLLVATVVFGAWAYSERQDYKNNTDQKIAVAVDDAERKLSATKAQEFTEKYKQPLTTFKGPSAFGSIRLKYPKTWSGYVKEEDSSPFIDGYFAPGEVPSTNDSGSVFALRLEIVERKYSEVMADYESYVDQGESKVAPYHLPKIKSVVGSKVTGKLVTDDNKQGTMVILPLRANTLRVWVTSSNFKKDLNKYILPNLKFSP